MLNYHNYIRLRTKMATDVKCLWLAVKTSYAFAKTKYDYQTRNTKGIINVKEQIYLTNVKY